MNPTFKQLEAFYYSATLGSFSAAASALHSTQSAISKRVSDLENEAGSRLLNRSPSGLRMTALGQRILPMSEEAIRLRQRLGDATGHPIQWEGTFRLGVTELTALTWLGGLVRSLHEQHPALQLEPRVDAGLILLEALRNHELDMIIIPGMQWGDTFQSVQIGSVQNVWMASPALGLPDRVLRPQEFSGYPVLTQSQGSSKNQYYEAWLAEHGFQVNKVFCTNSLPVLGELTIHGLGISQLSPEYFRPEIEQGVLHIVRSDPMPPPMVYSALWRRDTMDARKEAIAALAAQRCDFKRRTRG